jgi:hypothetical protein
VREIHEAQHPEDDRQAESDRNVDESADEAVEQLPGELREDDVDECNSPLLVTLKGPTPNGGAGPQKLTIG